MLKALNLSKAFDGKPVIRALSLHLEKGGHYALMGPSGCGKTTLLNLLMGLIKPDAGQVQGLEQARISAVFQEDRLLEHLTATENIHFVSPVPRDTAEALLEELGLKKESFAQPVSEFSGGMKRRVALARALLCEYDLLFLDEPFKGLDEDTRRQAKAVLKKMTQGKTLLMVTHDPQDAEGFEPIHL